ncbi:unnamed protein product [Rotaria sp. Silwood2]|nr:unnamed protein product [Rotaria sp. Silwood2]CAF2646181.1 unnamed protein product [Rotaria sp. Silwood2]CAF3038537.1 unnamed protein product [Rotaria sp. Silwood2]CAF3932696.1 unnamed protein product [Rotaria sp. Silwood2]CAF4030909.1 unnamed protein product [Rotaria sp. Silwood2]
MKFLWYFFLTIQIGIKAESLSLSFINIIPSIIANGRFVKDNIINSDAIIHPTLPSINIDLIFNVNGSNCSRDIQLLSHDLINLQAWALKTFDAWGKLPSGLMQGNIYWIGSVFECQHYLRGLNDSIITQPFKTRTCTIGNGLSNTIRPVYGICVPQSCNANDIVDFINQRVIRIPFIKHLINITNIDIHCIEHRQLDIAAILTIVLISVIIFLILLATGLHIIYGHEHDLKMDDEHPTVESAPLLSRTTTTHLPSEINPIDERDQSTSSDELTPLVSKSQRNVDSVARNLISCCSLLNNYHILKSDSYPKNLACLNGIRVLSLCWIILGHTFIFAVYYSDNLMTIFNWSRKLWFQIIVQTFFSIDSFFLLSGLLTAFTYFVSKTENEKFSIIKFFLNHYVHHYLRYTPLYAIILLIYITLSPYMGQDGPVYPIDGIETASCRRTWWRNLLYINNLFDMRDGCMPVTWFLAVNMQFHWITPLFLLIVSWKWLLGILVSIIFIIVDIVATSVIVSKNNYEYGLLSDLYSNRSNFSNITNGYLNDVYVKPWCRIAPYAVGLSIGYIFYEVYQRSSTSLWDSLMRRTTIHSRHYYFKRIFVWIFALTILSLCIFGTYGDYSGHPLTRRNRIVFLTLSRLAWSIGLCAIIIDCFAGHGAIANRLLSRPCFYKLSKLTYGAYLWHSLVIFVNYLSREQPTHYTITNIFYNFICYTIISYILSFFTFLLFELPTVQLLEFCFKRSTKLH